jgi:tetratricopeptide (TPR) repeat protein
MNNNIGTVLREGRRLREHGRYAEAARVLEASLRAHGSDVELAVELGETLLIQGYYSRAMAVLEENLTDSEAPSSLTTSAGKLICCLARVFCTGQFRESLSLADNIYSAFLSSKDSENFNDATV